MPDLDRPERAFLSFGSDDATGAGPLLGHLPALDGVRGLAVVAVVLFHGNWPWARGGFLGVSMFFTLSGFLITSLLIAEHRRSGQVALGAFWGRRFRRLLPAAWLTLVVVVAVSAALGEFTSAARADVWASLGNVANWRFLAAGTSYNDLFAHPSPVRHFWSLAIEEQCYLVVPLVVGAALRFGRGRLSALAAVLGAFLAGSVAVTLLSSGGDRVYYGTDARAAELLIGSLLAVAVAHEPFRRRVALGLWPRWTVQGAGAIALGVTVAAWTSVSVTDSIVGGGGLVVVAVLSSALVLTGATGSGPLAATFSLAPLRFLGRISYGVYLFHWPIFVFLTERRTGLDHAPRFVLQVALAVGLATLSHRWFEQPLRRSTWRIGALGGVRVGAIGVAALVLATLLVGTAGQRTVGFDADRAAAGLRRINQQTVASLADPVQGSVGSAPADTAPDSPLPPVPPVPSVAMFGDSISLSIAYSLHPWSLRSGQIRFLGGDTELGCGIGRGGRERGPAEIARTPTCDGWQSRWERFIAETHPDIAVVQSSQWELVDRLLTGDDSWRAVGDPTYDDYLRSEFVTATDVLSADGALVVWVTVPHFSHLDDDSLNAAMRRSHSDERVERLNRIIGEVAAERPDQARVIDLARWMAGHVDDGSLRRDGAHFNDSGAERIAAEFFGPELVSIWQDWQPAAVGTSGG